MSITTAKTKTKEKSKSSVRNQTAAKATLVFDQGDLIVKEGDFGISIYHVVKGSVGIFVTKNKEELHIATLGPGEIFGEMVFLQGSQTRRSASARAMEDSTLEAWHPEKLKEDYNRMPIIIRYMANQTANHLLRINKALGELIRQKEQAAQKQQRRESAMQQRDFRKDVDLNCLYRPQGVDGDVRIWGRIKNISKGGLRLDTRKINMVEYSYARGETFVGEAFLPNGKRIDFSMKIANARVLKDNRTLSLGMYFSDMKPASRNALGFFLLGKA